MPLGNRALLEEKALAEAARNSRPCKKTNGPNLMFNCQPSANGRREWALPSSGRGDARYQSGYLPVVDHVRHTRDDAMPKDRREFMKVAGATAAAGLRWQALRRPPRQRRPGSSGRSMRSPLMPTARCSTCFPSPHCASSCSRARARSLRRLGASSSCYAA